MNLNHSRRDKKILPMNPLLPLIQFSSKQNQSYSVLVDFQQIYVRNVVLFCTGLSMVRVLFGDVIHCQNTESSVSQTYVDTLCFVNGTLTIEPDATVYHDYYQWVSVYLLLLGFGFYLPYSLWAKVHGNYLRHLESLAGKPEEAVQVIRLSKGNGLFFKTLALEWFYAFYLILLLGLTDRFFNHLWSEMGWSWRAIYRIFPNQGSCFFEYFQSSGTSTGRFKCLLPLCSVYRKVFFALYWVMVGLIVGNVLMIAYHTVLAVRRRTWVDAWWAASIVKRCAVSWYVQERMKGALYEGEVLKQETIV